jgi:glycosyltransferase involved in cell wall biosynthesis
MNNPATSPDGAPAVPRISIVIPAYNYGHVVQRAIESVLTQMRPDCELLVIDDGSTDCTPQILAEMNAQHRPGFRWVRQENAGAAAARNAGLRLSRGAFLLFFDADDELLPNALNAICSTIDSNPQASVILGGRITRRTDGREKYHPPPTRLDADPCARVADYLLHKRIGMGHGSTAMRRDLIEQRGYPENLKGSEDIPVFAHLFAWGTFAIADHPLVLIHKHRDSLRHFKPASDERATVLVEEIFGGLPEACQKFRAPYVARRYLSLCRIALRAGDVVAAKKYFRQAIKVDLLQILQPGQARKLLKAGLSMLARRSRQ